MGRNEQQESKKYTNLVSYAPPRPPGMNEVWMLGCADEDGAYISKRMLRDGTSDNTPKTEVLIRKLSTLIGQGKAHDLKRHLNR